MNIESTQNPRSKDIDFLTTKINEETQQFGEASPFGFFVKDDDENIIAGANGFILYGSVYTDQLWVSKEHREKGLAKQIMMNIHDLGRKHDCHIATIQTMEFQSAAEFYKKLGYIIDRTYAKPI